MTRLAADILFIAVLASGMALIVGFILVGHLTAPRPLPHPQGRVGELRDQLLTAIVFGPLFGMSILGMLMDDMRESAWALPAFACSFAVAIAGLFLPPVKRACQRLLSLRSDPPQ